MAKRGGYPGGMMPGNMNNLMKQAQKMQRQMEETTQELETKTYEASAGGGVVKVMISGKKEVISVKIDEEVVDKDDIEMLGELVDIHKDIANEEYWEKKKEVMGMNYREYGNYGNEGYGARRRDSRGRYMERGRGGNYRGHEIMDEMYGAYGEYSEGREEYGRGNYGAKENTMKSLEYMDEYKIRIVNLSSLLLKI